MSIQSFDSSGTNQELRLFKKNNYEIHAKQRAAFKKIIEIGLEIDLKDSKLMKMIQMGIPSVYREYFWPKLMQNVHGITLQFYQILLNKASKLMSLPNKQISEQKQKIIRHLNSIERDIERTFPEMKFFKKENQQGQALFNVLSAWTVFRQQLGYLQGMSQIAGFLLVQLKQIEVFPTFCSIMTTDIIYAYYSLDSEEMQKFQNAFEFRLKRGNEKVFFRLKQFEIESRAYIFNWIITLFTRIIDIESIGKFWDILFLHEIDQAILIQVSFWLIHHFSHIILDPYLESQEIIQNLKSCKLNQLDAQNVLTNLRGSKRI